ncbi:MAG TPA: S-layer homology domain-containing protein [Clostridiales bacterium]|nr:S-layer homology domain-containing protein [Clostridiales bacterium]
MNDPALTGRKPFFRDWIIVSGVNNGMPVLAGVGSTNTAKPVISDASATHDLAATAEISFDSDMLGEYYYALVAPGADMPNIDTDGSGELCYGGKNSYTIPAAAGAWDIYVVVKGLNGKESTPAKIELAAEPALFAGGTGSKDDPYQITTAYHLHNVRYFLDDHFIMMDDIDLDPDVLDDAFWYDPALGWDPIGSGDIYESPFAGQFDGNGKKIKNMTITFSSSTGYSSGNVGLFGYVNTAGAIYDLGIVSCDLSSTYYGGGAGGLTGTLYGTVDHCYATGSISVGAINAGGLVGNNYSASIINSWAAMDIESIGWSYVGGLVGYNDGTIRNCGASGSIQGGNGTRAGGSTGFNQSYDDQSTIQNCYAAGAVSGIGWGFVGPFYGENQESFSGASFKDCYWNEDATITATENGGQTPTVHGSTSNCLAKDSDYMKSQDFVNALNDGLPGTTGYYQWEIIESINDGYPILKAEFTEDTLSPTVASNTISASSVTKNSAILSWNEATDNITAGQNLQYCVYKSSANNIGSVADMEANATAISDFAHRSTYTVTGLSANQTYYFNIIVKDEAGNKTAYKTASLTTVANPLDTYQISATANAGGTITPPGNSVVTKSDSITFTIQADAGYIIKDVLVDGVSVGAVSSYTFSAVKANHSIEAIFEHDCPAKQFSDVDITQWYHEGIDFVLQAGLFVGTSETKFSPNTNMTRAMLVTMLWRIEKEPVSNAANPFTDVPANTWYTAAVIWATETGVIKGYDQDTFGSKDPITREQMATILYRYASVKGYDVSAADSLNQFTDAGKVSPWAADAVKWAVAEGLIHGVKATLLDPGGKTSRAQVATILMRFVTSIEE